MQGKPRPIKEVCIERGLKITWLANQLGMTQPKLSHIILGTRAAPPNFFERVAGILNVPLERVLPPPEKKDEVAA